MGSSPFIGGLCGGSFPAPHHHDPNEMLPNFQIWVMVASHSPIARRGRCRVVFTPAILGIISMGPCIWYSFVTTVAGLHVFVVSLDIALTLDGSSTTGQSFPRKAPTAWRWHSSMFSKLTITPKL